MDFKADIASDRDMLALGAESAGNFCYKKNGRVFLSPDLGDLSLEKNWNNFRKDLGNELEKSGLHPSVILSDLHPDFGTTKLAAALAKKFKADHIPVQHHLAHVFSAIGDRMAEDSKYKIPDTVYGIACDGTGLGLDGTVWGGEILKISNLQFPISNKILKSKCQIERLGYLENQTMIGGDLAIREPARMVIAILDKFLPKEKTYNHVKKYYTKNEFELLWNQHRQNFNCLETSSTGRILDAVSLLLGFCQNERTHKHGPIEELEKNTTEPYKNIEPKIERIRDKKMKTFHYELNTTYLFNYIIHCLHRDKKRLAATAQSYIARGLYEIIQKTQDTKQKNPDTFFAGGMANNKIMSSYLESKGIYVSKKIPRGDAGISFGQLMFGCLTNSRNQLSLRNFDPSQ